MADRRLELGFEGGSVLRLTVDESVASDLTGSLAAGGWHVLEAREGVHHVNLGEVLFVRLPAQVGRVGFGHGEG